MKHHLILALTLLIPSLSWADTVCSKVVQGDRILKEEGDCSLATPPACSFNIALSLMGYDAGVLESPEWPEWDFDAKKYPNTTNPIWQKAYTPRLWLEYSSVWYSQELSRHLGYDTLQSYVQAFEYGNQDTSGNPGQNDGLTEAWFSSLHISANEQIAFVQKIIDRRLPVSEAAYVNTQAILKRREMHGHPLYGKTGMDAFVDANGVRDPMRMMGWFVGWVESEDEPLVFVHLVEKAPNQGAYASHVARDQLYAYMDDLFDPNP